MLKMLLLVPISGIESVTGRKLRAGEGEGRVRNRFGVNRGHERGAPGYALVAHLEILRALHVHTVVPPSETRGSVASAARSWFSDSPPPPVSGEEAAGACAASSVGCAPSL